MSQEQIVKAIEAAIDAVYAGLALKPSPEVESKLSDALESLVSALHGDYEDEDFEDSMDGDAQSALASVGWGTDEDYIADNDYFDNY